MIEVQLATCDDLLTSLETLDNEAFSINVAQEANHTLVQ